MNYNSIQHASECDPISLQLNMPLRLSPFIHHRESLDSDWSRKSSLPTGKHDQTGMSSYRISIAKNTVVERWSGCSGKNFQSRGQCYLETTSLNLDDL